MGYRLKCLILRHVAGVRFFPEPGRLRVWVPERSAYLLETLIIRRPWGAIVHCQDAAGVPYVVRIQSGGRPDGLAALGGRIGAGARG